MAKMAKKKTFKAVAPVLKVLVRHLRTYFGIVTVASLDWQTSVVPCSGCT